MPELPEVETTRRGISPHLVGQEITAVEVRQRQLRWPVPRNLPAKLAGHKIDTVGRRAKYLLLTIGDGTLIVHLGMSGSLRIVESGTPPKPHDHVDIVLASGKCLRYHDPRRFGSMLWTKNEPEQHALLRHLGPEPFDQAFTAPYMYALSRGRRAAVKNFVMDSRVVVGVGNIYASESLFLARLNPKRAAGRVSIERYERLVAAVRKVLGDAIGAGGTTLRDFVNSDGNPGYFGQSLRVYERAGLACHECGAAIRQLRLGQRSSYYCPDCQRY